MEGGKCHEFSYYVSCVGLHTCSGFQVLGSHQLPIPTSLLRLATPLTWMCNIQTVVRHNECLAEFSKQYSTSSRACVVLLAPGGEGGGGGGRGGIGETDL